MITEALSCLFQEFGQVATITRSNQHIEVVFDGIEEETRLGIAELQHITASALIRPTDKLHIQHHDILLLSQDEHYRIERTQRQPSGLIKLLLSEAENRDEYFHFTV